MFDSIKASKNIKEEFIDYVSTTYQFSNADLNKKFKDQLNQEIAKGPYVEINSIYKTSGTLRDLISENPTLFSSRFLDLEKGKSNPVIPLDRNLYTHQKEAILKSVSGDNVIISTGTGSGKTLCFLIPVLNDLLKEIDQKHCNSLSDGVRAIFIFPMNALANDQIKNIRSILKDYPAISFGVYNGATDDRREDAELHYEVTETSDGKKIRDIPTNERISRDEMKAHPPNILFTNYAMLEHLLFRPDDDVLFSRSETRYIILDEAHVYSGISGIETSFLISRLKARLSAGKTQFILTSATLGSSKEDIIDFGHRLCGESFEIDDVITAQRVEDDYIDTNLPLTSFQDVLSNKKFENIDDNDFATREELYMQIPYTYEYRELREKYCGVYLLSDLEKAMHYSSEDMLKMLDFCTKARKDGHALIDIKYHFFIRCLDGCYMSLYPKTTLSLVRKKSTMIDNIQASMFEIGLCDDCGEIAIFGKEKDGKLVYSKIYDEDMECFCLASHFNSNIDYDDEEEREIDTGGDRYLLCPQCGAISKLGETNHLCEHSSSNYIEIVKIEPTLGKKFKCPHCHKGELYRFFLGNDAATSVLATALYEELSVDAGEKFPQFLIFSDSRQEAAKFACYLGEFYNNEIIRRRAIYQTTLEMENRFSSIQTISMTDFASSLTNYFANHNIYSTSFDCEKNAWVALMNEIVRQEAATSLSSLGLIQFQYSKINSDARYRSLYDKYKHFNNISWENFVELLNLLFVEMVNMDAIKLNSNSTLIGYDERNYIFHHGSQKSLCLFDDKEKKNRVQWIPKNNGSHSSYHTTNRMYYVQMALGIDSQEVAAQFLMDFFDVVFNGKKDDATLNIEDFNVVVGKQIKQYECPECHKVSSYTLNGKCLVSGCNGRCVHADSEKLFKDNHYAKLYKENVMQPLLVKEHTAQLSRRESTEYQDQFRLKQINALSCSTTFEMGIDIGNLEAIFLRNVPPTPSNYSQRAGRAGRSVDSAAYVLNYAKLSSHDLSFFANPVSMINGEIKAPYFKLNNEKIALRHVYAVAFSLFFRTFKKDNYYGFKEFVDSEKGYRAFIKWLETKPDALKEELMRSIPNDEDLYEKLGLYDFTWCDYLYKNEDASLKKAVEEYQANKKEYQSEIEKLTQNKSLYSLDSKTRQEANDLADRLERYTRKELIDFLARNNILPRHGFPIDTVELQQNYFTPYDRFKRLKDPDDLQLSRDLKIAISEYAPSAQVVADGSLYTSRYIAKPVLKTNHNKWHSSYIAQCPNDNCKAINYFLIKKDQKCSCCGGDIPREYLEESIEPRDGFVAEANVKKVPMDSLDKQYSTEAAFIGNIGSSNLNRTINFGVHSLKMTFASDQELMLRSQSHFYTCDECGYTLADDEKISDSANKKDAKSANYEITNGLDEVNMGSIKHKNFYNSDCPSHTLHRYYLHHVFKTDVVKIDFDDMVTSDYTEMLSVMYAVYNSIANVLQIEKRELNCCLSISLIDGVKKQSLIIFDNVPGGAGHTKYLFESDDGLVEQIIYQALYKVENCDCDPSCYKCLRSYENRMYHDDLDRFKASNFLSEFTKLED